jgi:hypothetical protein
MTSVSVLEALAVTAELTGTQLSAAAAKVMASDLAPYPEGQVLGALARCRKELKGRLTVADVVSRLDDGRPGPEEAWALMPFNEMNTVVWTEEMAGAWGVARTLIEDDDKIGARMAFLESYRSRVQKARDAATPVKWTVSFGRYVENRESAVQHAVQLGRLTPQRAIELGYDPGPAAPAIENMASKLANRLTGGE